jgi:filamentous hemagglutinin family protein
MTRGQLSVLLCIVLVAMLPARRSNAGQVVTDGTVGAASTLSGPNFAIPASLGRQVGPNLFHSFSTFNLAKGDIATFTASAATKAILARITGGAVSSIDGTIATRLDTSPTTPHPASFYLINPSGIIFGPDAKLDVGGSFVVATSDTVQLADGGQFNAATPQSSVLTSAAPAAFGFLKSNPAPVAVNGSALAVTAGHALSIIGGSGSQIGSASLTAPTGRINVLCVGGSGEVTGDAGNPLVVPALGPQTPGGSVVIANSQLSVNGSGGGAIAIQASNVGIGTSTLFANNAGTTAGAGITINATGDVLLSSGSLAASSSSTGIGGPVLIQGNNITANDFAFYTATGAAPAGNITLIASGALDLIDGGGAISVTAGAGRTGNITATARNVLIDGGSSGTLSGLVTETTGSGPGGDITLKALDKIDLLNSGLADSITMGTGNAGNVSASAHDIRADAGSTGSTTGHFTGIFSQSTAGGNAGAVSVTATNLTLQNLDGGVFSLTEGTGNAGTVTVNANAIVIDAPTTFYYTGITADTLGGGNAGVVRINASTLSSRGGGISAGAVALSTQSAHATGASGTISINVSTKLSLSNTLVLAYTDLISSDTSLPAPGEIVIAAPTMNFTNGTIISTTTNAASAGGLIDLSGEKISFYSNSGVESGSTGAGRSGDVSVTASNRLTIDGLKTGTNGTGLFANTLATGAAGGISVDAGSIFITGTDAGIVSDNFSPEPGGNVTLHAGFIYLNHFNTSTTPQASIQADSGGSGDAGKIKITTGTLEVLGGAFVATDAADLGKAGDVNIDASGKVLILAPTSVISSSSGTMAAGGGDVTVSADSLQIAGGAGLAALSLGPGPAGNVRVTTTGNIGLSYGGEINISANDHGGDINVVSRRGNLSLTNDSLISAAAGAGGNISLDARQAIDVLDSKVTAKARHSGGQITIGPPVVDGAPVISLDDPLPRGVILNSSTINGLVSEGNLDLKVLINSAQFVESSDSQILSNLASLPLEYDIAAGLTPLQGSLVLPGATLIPQCGQMVDSPNLSSFIVTGFGGAPPEPGGWISGGIIQRSQK